MPKTVQPMTARELAQCLLQLDNPDAPLTLQGAVDELVIDFYQTGVDTDELHLFTEPAADVLELDTPTNRLELNT